MKPITFTESELLVLAAYLEVCTPFDPIAIIIRLHMEQYADRIRTDTENHMQRLKGLQKEFEPDDIMYATLGKMIQSCE